MDRIAYRCLAMLLAFAGLEVRIRFGAFQIIVILEEAP
jgi:hypothetical protein